MNPTYDAQGFLTKVEGSFGYGRSVSLTKWADSVFVHINDNSKCWDNKRFDKTKGKSVSLNCKNTEALADCLIQLRPFADQINAEQVMKVPVKQQMQDLQEACFQDNSQESCRTNEAEPSQQLSQQQQEERRPSPSGIIQRKQLEDQSECSFSGQQQKPRLARQQEEHRSTPSVRFQPY